MTVQINNLYAKVDEIFGFNLSKTTEGVDYNFWQYRLNQLYKPLVKFFLKKFEESLNTYPTEEADKILTLFIDFFRLYFFQGDFWYFKNKYSSFTYKVPYARTTTGGDTDFWRATKDCYYVKTSDVENTMDIQIVDPDLSERPIRLQFFKKSKPDAQGNFTTLDIEIQEQRDPESDELLGYYITIYNRDETWAKASNKALIFKKIDELRIEKTPSLEARISDFLAKRGRDYFIHKRLKDFLSGELERYLFQALKSHPAERIALLQTQAQLQSSWVTEPADFGLGLIQQLSEKSALSCYQAAYLWIQSFINILADLEDFKAKLWNKTRKVIQQDYCISLGKIKELETLVSKKEWILQAIFANTAQLEERKQLWISATPSSEDDFLPVDTKHFSGAERSYLLDLIANAEVMWTLIQSDNYQALSYLQSSYAEAIKCIYIDPPYNTGNDGFVYKDGYSEASWLSMMQDRLLKAKELMSPDGVIFTSIGRQEQHSLWKLYDSLLPYTNPQNILQIAWQTAKGGWIKEKNWYENLFVHYKKWEKTVSGEDVVSYDFDYRPIFWKYWALLESRNFYFDWKVYIVLHWGEKCYVSDQKKLIDRIWSKYGNEVYRQYLKIDMKSWDYVDEKWKIIKLVQKKKNTGIQTRDWKLFYNMIQWLFSEKWLNLLEDIIWRVEFTTVKPIELLQEILGLNIVWNTILDFFAGSGTTGHAVMKLNKEDWWSRKFILVELANYFKSITLLRNKKVMYSQNRKDGQAQDNDGTIGILSYQTLNQYQDRFDAGGYLDTLQDEITSFATSDDFEQTTHILAPLQQLKEKIYDLDDTLTIEQLREKSSMLR